MTNIRARWLVVLGSVALLVGAAPMIGQAATINVTVGEVVRDDNGTCSLREAIINANDDAATHDDCPSGTGADTIVLASGSTYTLPDAPSGFDADGNNGLPSITSEITIEGNGATIERDTL